MIEVEAKVRADHGRVEGALESEGAEFVDEYRQRDVYLSAPHRDFAETDEAFRVREQGDDSFMTYKGPKLDDETKTREEHETPVGGADEALEIAVSLGFEVFAEVEKHRRVYRLDGATVVLDDVEGLGEFVEVERETEAGEDRTGAHEAIRGTLDRLGLDPDDGIRESYLELLYG